MHKLLKILILFCSGLSCLGGQSLESTYRTTGPAVREAFEFVRENLQNSSAVIKRGRQEVIFGTVVSTNGHILTKASELGEINGLSVIIDQETYTSPQLLAEDPLWDVALLKVEADSLIPIQFSPSNEQVQGTWLVANGPTTRRNRRVQIGVVSANEREVYAKGGTVLGVALKNDGDSDLIVAEVTEGSGAEEAGVESGDIVLAVDGETVGTRAEIAASLKERRVGDEVTLRLKRGDEEIDLQVPLSGRSELFGEEATRNDMMSGEYSERRSGFPRVMQHDIIGNRHFMGGPVFNLNGQCVGMNIARFSRSETYAIPARELMLITERMLKEKD